MARKRYLFFDIDGTLVAGGYGKDAIPPSAREALKKVRAAGHFTAIATGRSQAMAVEHMRELGFVNMVHDGGYGITIDNRLIGIRPLDRDKIIALVDECKAKGLPWGIQPENSVTRFVPDESFIEATHDVYMRAKVVEGLDPRNYPEIYKMYIACEEPVEYSLEALKGLPWCRFHKEYIFVEPADKAYGIRQIMDYYHADYKDVVVFGDAKNDLSMFVDEWTKVAMGNACDELKAKADYITTDALNHGIYHACEHLGLFEKADE